MGAPEKAPEDPQLEEAPEARQLEAWRGDKQWAEAMPRVQVSRPKGAFCQLDCSALVGLHPAAVFEVMCDTGNKRIFRNAEGVKDRRVLEDSPEKKVVELEMLTSWRFLFLSGEFSVNLRLTQDRPNCKLFFELSKPGFMKKFRGVWSVQAVPVPPSSVKLEATGSQKLGSTEQSGPGALDAEPADILELALRAADVEESKEEWKEDAPLASTLSEGVRSLPWYGPGTRVASRVLQTQQVQPSLNPPPLFAHYLRGIAAKTILEAMCDIQLEAARIRHGLPEDCNVLEELRSQGYVPLAVATGEASQGKKGEGQKPRAGKKGLRDWSVGEGKKASSSRRSKRLSEKEKWKVSRSLQDHLKDQCPSVRIAGQ